MKKTMISLVLMVCMFSACQKDVYDPNYNPNLEASVPENFDWSTTKTLNVNVEVKDEYDGKYNYAVRIYDKTPGEGVLPVAASSKVNKDMPFSQEIVVPATVTKLYIVQAFKKADASEVISKQEVAVDRGNISFSFGGAQSKTFSSTRASDNATELKAGMEIKNGASYFLKEEYTLKDIDDKVKNVTITVNKGGELKFSESVILPNQWVINIDHGGKLEAEDNTEITLGTNSVLSNYGEVRVHDINFINGATLYNGDAMDGKNEGACFYANIIHLEGGNGNGSEKRTLGQRSYTSCEKLELENVKLTFKTGAWLDCETLSVIKGGANTLQEDDDSQTITNTKYVGLATIEHIDISKGNLTITDKILVETEDYNKFEQDNVVEDASDKITIVGTSCSDGFEDDEETELGSYTYIFEDMYPEQGDYDMNDIVVTLTATQEDDELTIKGELKAVGAAYTIIPYIKVGNEQKPLKSENGKALDAHTIMGSPTSSTPINTERNGINLPAASFELEFDDVKRGLTIDDIDLYIVVGSNEIHWNTHDKAKGATWGMRIPKKDFKWAQEKVKITKAYPNFQKWFEDNSFPWYDTESDFIYKGK